MARRCWPLMQQGRLICQQGKVKPAPAIAAALYSLLCCAQGRLTRAPTARLRLASLLMGSPWGNATLRARGLTLSHPQGPLWYTWVIWRLQSSAPLRRFAAQWSRGLESPTSQFSGARFCRTGVSDISRYRDNFGRSQSS